MEAISQENFDPHQADVYVQHLADMNEIQEVIASQDIHNEFGVLLVPKGTRIKKSIADRLMGHKVEKPVHQVVSLSGCLNAKTLFGCFQGHIDKYPDLQIIQKALDYENKLKHLCTRSELPLALLQKVTVMKERLPVVFKRSLFCAWLGSMIANEMELGLDAVYNTFLVGLFHDIGLLHIEEALVKKDKDITDQEWKVLRTHVAVGKKIVASYNMLDEDVLVAIGEHHERCDGTGYPNHKQGEQLSKIGQIIAFCDTVFAIRFTKFHNTIKNLGDIQPYLQINHRTYFYATYQAFHKIFRRSALSPNIALSIEQFAEVKTALCQRNENLDTLHAQIRLLFQYLCQENLRGIGRPVAKSIQNSLVTIQRSGIVGPDIGTWLDSLQKNQFDEVVLEMQEFAAMQYELLFNIRRSFRYFGLFFSKEIKPNHSVYELLSSLSEEINEVLSGAWASFEV